MFEVFRMDRFNNSIVNRLNFVRKRPVYRAVTWLCEANKLLSRL